jgi:hypothetical protein
MLLDFLKPEGAEAGGQYNLLAIKLIEELDSRLSRPLHLKLKRPQLRSHPYLQGLNLLLRASGLSRVEGAGAKARLVLDPEMLVQWDQLNPTEQYFNLLEAWLLFGTPEMVGERGGALSSMLFDCMQSWRFLPESDKRSKKEPPREFHFYGRDLYKLALMELFGLAAVEHPRKPVTPWAPANAWRTPFGGAVFTSLFDWQFGISRAEDRVDEDDEEADDEEEGQDFPALGAWQPIFQPYFPEWQKNLEVVVPEAVEGIFIFRVSLGKDMWRRIAMPAEDTLDDLAGWILRSVNFDSDHLYEFILRNHMGAGIRISHPETGDGSGTDQIQVGELFLEPGQSMQFHYDFGDDWRFDVKLERIEPPDAKIKAPRILEKHGKSPKQYPNSDW